MRKSRIAILLSFLFIAASPLAMARGGGGGAGSHTSGPPASSQAAANSNGRFAKDRDTGLDRAEDRRSAEGTAHEKATSKAKKPAKTANPER